MLTQPPPPPPPPVGEASVWAPPEPPPPPAPTQITVTVPEPGFVQVKEPGVWPVVEDPLEPPPLEGKPRNQETSADPPAATCVAATASKATWPESEMKRRQGMKAEAAPEPS